MYKNRSYTDLYSANLLYYVFIFVNFAANIKAFLMFLTNKNE